MNCASKKIAALSLVVLVFARWTYSANPQVEPPSKMLFAVWPGQKGKQPDSPILDPIAVVSKSDFKQPIKYGDAQGKEAERLYVTFEKKYLSAGQKYPLLFGGHDVGVVEVQAAVGISCESLTATLKEPVPLLNAQKALAASSIEGFKYSHELAPAKYFLSASCLHRSSLWVPGEARSHKCLVFPD